MLKFLIKINFPLKSYNVLSHFITVSRNDLRRVFLVFCPKRHQLNKTNYIIYESCKSQKRIRSCVCFVQKVTVSMSCFQKIWPRQCSVSERRRERDKGRLTITRTTDVEHSGDSGEIFLHNLDYDTLLHRLLVMCFVFEERTQQPHFCMPLKSLICIQTTKFSKLL